MADKDSARRKALESIENELGSRAGKHALRQGTTATKAPQRPDGGDATGKPGAQDHASMDGPKPAQDSADRPGAGFNPSAHLTPGKPATADTGNIQPNTGSVPDGAVQSYLAKGYSPADHAAHLKEHFHRPVSEMVAKYSR